MDQDLLYKIAITLIPGIGDVLTKKLIAYCGSPEAVFRESSRKLRKIPGIGDTLSQAASNASVFKRAEQEMAFIQKYKINPLYFQDKEYPSRLNHCSDSPVMLYYKGTADLNALHVVAVVGTRTPTEYGKSVCSRLIEEIITSGLMVVSGLAYGIDSVAHRRSLELHIPTVAILGHGLDMIYPYMNKSLAERMIENGGLLTDFISKNKPDRENFPKRNRIIAGMSDAVIVVEAARKGGALITADIANSYNRDVYGIPGRIDDPYSAGCNMLISSNRAALVQSGQEIKFLMGIEQREKEINPIQKKLFLNLSPEEQVLIDVLEKYGAMGIDDLSIQCQLNMNKTASALLNLEFEEIVKCLPGRMYMLI